MPDCRRLCFVAMRLTFMSSWFEVFECVRKLLLIGVPVFMPHGSFGQLINGLVVCFLTFGAQCVFNPYINYDGRWPCLGVGEPTTSLQRTLNSTRVTTDDLLSQLAQMTMCVARLDPPMPG